MANLYTFSDFDLERLLEIRAAGNGVSTLVDAIPDLVKHLRALDAALRIACNEHDACCENNRLCYCHAEIARCRETLIRNELRGFVPVTDHAFADESPHINAHRGYESCRICTLSRDRHALQEPPHGSD